MNNKVFGVGDFKYAI